METPQDQKKYWLNTLPSMKNLLHNELLFEAMALNAIVGETMCENIQASIIFSNNGSSMNGVKASLVQSLKFVPAIFYRIFIKFSTKW